MIAVPPGQGAEEDAADGGDEDAPVATRTVGDTRGRTDPALVRGLLDGVLVGPSYLGGKRPNPIFARLVQTLAAGGNGAPTIRIGGNSTDESWWNPVAAPRPAGVATDVTPAMARRPRPMGGQHAHADHPRRSTSRCGDSANAAAYAAGGRRRRCRPGPARRARDRQRARPLHASARVRGGHRGASSRGLRRPAGYGPADYRSELQTFRAALEAAAPGVPMAGGGFATSAWEDGEDDLLSEPGPGPMGFSAHTYALHTCDRRRRDRAVLRAGRCWARARSPRRWRAWRSSPRSPPPTARPSGYRRRTRPTAAGCTARATASPRRCGASTCSSRSPTPACAT